MLLATQQVARAPEFKIERGNLEARPKVRKLLEGGEPLAGNVRKGAIGGNQHVGIGTAV